MAVRPMLNVFHPDASTASTLTLLPVPAYVSFQQDPQYGELKLARNTPPMYGNAGRLSKVVYPKDHVASDQQIGYRKRANLW